MKRNIVQRLAAWVCVLSTTSVLAIKFHQDINMQGNNLINAGGNRITNVAPGVADADAVNVSQLTNMSGNVYGVINNLSNYIGNVMITNVANYQYLTNQLDATYVNVTGDTMTGPLTINNNLIVNGEIFAVTSTFVNIVVSNTALIATNLTVQGVLDMGGNRITNVAPGSSGTDAVNYDQLTNALGAAGGNLTAATNAVVNQLITYVDAATNAVGETWDERWVNESGDDMTGILGMGGNRITNLAPGVAGTDAVNLNQLTNATAGAAAQLSALSNYIADVMITNVANYHYLTGQVDNTYVNITGDDMTGVLGMGGNQITNLGAATRGDMAVNYNQLTNAMQQVQNAVDLQKAYENGNTITTSASEGDVVVSGTQALKVTATGGVQVNGGSVSVNGSTTQGVNLDGGTGNESIRLNANGKIVIYSGGSLAMEFE